MEIYLVTIKTKDCETYQYAFKKEPTEEEYRIKFFEDYGDTYEEDDWGYCIDNKVTKLELE